MKHTLRMVALALALCLPLAGPVAADQFQDGLAAFDSGDYATALRLFQPLAKQGDADSLYQLGLMDENGLGEPKDYAEAVKWFRKAAEQGHVLAQYNLSILYENGLGIPQDDALAYMWSNLAAAGVPPGFAVAEGWTVAFVDYRDRIARHMTPADISKAQKLASEWRPKTWDELKGQLPQ